MKIVILSKSMAVFFVLMFAGCGKPPTNDETSLPSQDSEIQPGEMFVISGAPVPGETMTVKGRFAKDSLTSGLPFIGVSVIAKARRPNGVWVNESGKTAPVVQENEEIYSFEAEMKVPGKPGTYQLECRIHNDLVAEGKVDIPAKP